MLKPKNDVSISSVLEGRTGLALQSALHTGQCDKDPLPLDKGLPVVGRRIEVAELSSASAFVSEAGSGSHCPAFGRAVISQLFVIQTTEGRKNLGNIHKYDYVDVPEILRFALNDKECLTDISLTKIKRLNVLIKTPKRFTSNTEAFWFERRSPCLFFVIHREGSVYR